MLIVASCSVHRWIEDFTAWWRAVSQDVPCLLLRAALVELAAPAVAPSSDGNRLARALFVQWPTSFIFAVNNLVLLLYPSLAINYTFPLYGGGWGF